MLKNLVLNTTVEKGSSDLPYQLCLLEDGRIYMLYKGTIVAKSRLLKNNKILREEKRMEKLLNKEEYVFTVIKNKKEQAISLILTIPGIHLD